MELIESCKKAIAEGRCLGCVALADINFRGNPNCEFSRIPNAEESILKIKNILGVQEKIWK